MFVQDQEELKNICRLFADETKMLIIHKRKALSVCPGPVIDELLFKSFFIHYFDDKLVWETEIGCATVVLPLRFSVSVPLGPAESEATVGILVWSETPVAPTRMRSAHLQKNDWKNNLQESNPVKCGLVLVWFWDVFSLLSGGGETSVAAVRDKNPPTPDKHVRETSCSGWNPSLHQSHIPSGSVYTCHFPQLSFLSTLHLLCHRLISSPSLFLPLGWISFPLPAFPPVSAVCLRWVAGR